MKRVYNSMVVFDVDDGISQTELILDNFEVVSNANIVILRNCNDSYFLLKNRWGPDNITLTKNEYLKLIETPQTYCENII